jgi:hypothetical protein
MPRATKIVTGTGAVTATLLPSASVFYGISATSAEATTFYVKLWWEGTGTAPPSVVGGAQPATVLPTAGTTVPHLVFQVPTTGLPLSVANVEVNNGGRIWYWIAGGAADSSTTALVAGGDNITFVYD